MRHDAGVGEKARLRQVIRARRIEQGSSVVDPYIADRLPAMTSVAGYLAMVDEPNIDALLSAFLMQGVNVYLPRVAEKDLVWVLAPDIDNTSIGAFGVREPHGESPEGTTAVDAVFLPALAVDRRGYRLGQGGGYYDRALENVRAYIDGGPLRIAVINNDEFLDVVPSEKHDVPVDVVCTPTSVHWIDERLKPSR